jgi:D-galactarolactone cycloisomerase
VKLKVGFGVEEDAAVTRAVRAAIRPGVALMVDALGRMIEGQDILWFEEPVPPEDVAGYREVKAALAIPIAGGECKYTRFGFRDLVVVRAMDIIKPDTCALRRSRPSPVNSHSPSQTSLSTGARQQGRL